MPWELGGRSDPQGRENFCRGQNLTLVLKGTDLILGEWKGTVGRISKTGKECKQHVQETGEQSGLAGR